MCPSSAFGLHRWLNQCQSDCFGIFWWIDPSWLESIKIYYKASGIKRVVLLSCRATLIASPSCASQNKPKISGSKFKCKLRDYQLVGLNRLGKTVLIMSR
eukprot:732275_1